MLALICSGQNTSKLYELHKVVMDWIGMLVFIKLVN